MSQLSSAVRIIQSYGEPRHIVHWLFDWREGPSTSVIARWLFLRALAVIYFSAFFSLLFQIRGLIGPQGLLPAQRYSSKCKRPRCLALLVRSLLGLLALRKFGTS